MVVLHDRVEAALAKLGYREEHRRFQPHMTIGRVRGAGPSITELGALVQQHADFKAGRLTVAKVTLFASSLTADGPIYDPLGTASL
jgi:RNA 2',3'-cyclic 3'-phosphodiesterase